MKDVEISNAMRTMNHKDVPDHWLPVVLALAENADYEPNVGIMFIKYWNESYSSWNGEDAMELVDDQIVKLSDFWALYSAFRDEIAVSYMADMLTHR